jgi:hypothetical protein
MESIEQAAKVAQELLDKEAATDPATRTALSIVKEFIQTNKVLCYGGTAINNLLPKEDQFYDPTKDVPDYDFFSETPQAHAVKIADRLASEGFESVEVKPGVHVGTFKVFCDFNGVADISHLDKPIFKKLWESSITKSGIHYVPPNFLRMSMYLELSRPRGDVSRWKKVYTRLQLLNKHYPIKCPSLKAKVEERHLMDDKLETFLKSHDVVLLGFNAADMNHKGVSGNLKFPVDLLVTPENRDEVASKVHDMLKERTRREEYKAFGELFPPHTDIDDSKSGDTLVRIYETDACHSYHEAESGLKIASIPTLLQFMFSAMYAPRHFLAEVPLEKYICVADKLVEIANDSGSRKYKLLTPISCLGKQKTLIDMRMEKSELYEKLKDSPKFLEVFFTYSPTSMDKTKRRKIKAKLKTLRAGSKRTL